MKIKSLLSYIRHDELEGVDFVSIGDDVMLFEKPVFTSVFQYPFRVDVTASIICIKGTVDGYINLKRYTIDKPCFITILPDHITEYKFISKDFSCLIILMSKKFTDSLMPYAHERLPLSLFIRDKSVMN